MYLWAMWNWEQDRSVSFLGIYRSDLVHFLGYCPGCSTVFKFEASPFSYIWRAFGAVTYEYLLEQKEGGGGMSMVLFFCIFLSVVSSAATQWIYVQYVYKLMELSRDDYIFSSRYRHWSCGSIAPALPTAYIAMMATSLSSLLIFFSLCVAAWGLASIS